MTVWTGDTTSPVDSLRRPEHALLLAGPAQLGFARKVLPLGLAFLQFTSRLDLPRHLRRPGGPVADLAGFLAGLAGQGRVDVGRGGDDARVGRGGGRGLRGWRAWGSISLALARVTAGDGLEVFGGQGLRGPVGLEGDDVDGVARGAGDGGDAGRVEGVVARDPARQHGVIDREGHRRGGLVGRGGLRGGLAVAGLVGGVLLLGPLLRGRRRRGGLGGS